MRMHTQIDRRARRVGRPMRTDTHTDVHARATSRPVATAALSSTADNRCRCCRGVDDDDDDDSRAKCLLSNVCVCVCVKFTSIKYSFHVDLAFEQQQNSHCVAAFNVESLDNAHASSIT